VSKRRRGKRRGGGETSARAQARGVATAWVKTPSSHASFLLPITERGEKKERGEKETGREIGYQLTVRNTCASS